MLFLIFFFRIQLQSFISPDSISNWKLGSSRHMRDSDGSIELISVGGLEDNDGLKDGRSVGSNVG